MTLGNAAKAELRLIVWSRCCEHQFEPDSPNLRGGMVDIAAWSQRLGLEQIRAGIPREQDRG